MAESKNSTGAVVKLVVSIAAIVVGLFVVVFVPALSMWLPTVLGLT